MNRQSILLFVISCFSFSLFAQKGGNPVELGEVNWIRDFDKGLEQSSAEGKPIFLLFQEVPGCMTCRNYGQQVLSHPLIVDAIQELFVPVAIYNNKGGKDADVLKYYGEPSWNNPVVRIVDYDKLDIVPRVSGNYTPYGVVRAMVYTLQRQQRAIPAYLQLLYDELKAAKLGTAEATFSMYCFWTGEKTYGAIDGVLSTEAGFMDGHEVVRVTYDPDVVALEDIATSGKQASCADGAYLEDKAERANVSTVLSASKVKSTSSFRADRTPKYYLAQTHYRAVPMTPIQAARANALIGKGQSPDAVLSPRQIAWSQRLKAQPKSKWKNRIGVDLVAGWKDL